MIKTMKGENIDRPFSEMRKLKSNKNSYVKKENYGG